MLPTSTDPDSRPLTPGLRVGRYQLVRLLGEGGMGIVWEAVLLGPEGFRRSVALKLLRPTQDPAGARKALTHEARLGALLSHPNVVATYEVGEADRTWYLAMELVRGPTVSELARQGRVAPGVVLDIGIQVCAGLAHVHGLEIDGSPAGLVHRDIKPRNLLVDRSGLVKIADLGVARYGDTRDRAAGTAGYVAPEQIACTEDARADLFSLGVVLFVLATDKMPFGKGNVALANVLEADDFLEDGRLLAAVDARVPGLGPLVGRCLRTHPADRWASASELGGALRGLRAGVGASPSLLDVLSGVTPSVRPAESASSSGRAPASTTATAVFAVGNLPRGGDRYVGREAERARLRELIREPASLVTVIGMGGMGKTRISLETARALGSELAGGAWFCDLSAATDEASVVAAVAAVLGVPRGRDADPVGQVGHALQARGRALLILDNLEQVVDAAVRPIERWRALAPETTLVVTTRIALRLPEERLLPLGPLELADALRLFTERASRPLTAEEAPAVEPLVRALEGLPLAIELAAARTRMLPVQTILARLDERFRLLSGGGRERPERHRSVRASLDGSFELLTPAQRDTLAQLSVFCDGFTLEAAEAVVDLSEDPDAPWALDRIEALVDQSLLRYDRADSRFRMLQMVRDYAAESLTEGQAAAVRRRHAAWFANLGSDDHLETLRGPVGPALLRRLMLEREDLLSACRHALEAGPSDQAVPLLCAVWTILGLQGPAAVAEQLARAVLASALDPVGRARAALVLAEAIDHQARLAEAAEAFAAAVEAARAAGALLEEARALGGLAMVARQRGDIPRALEGYHASSAAFRRAGDLSGAARMQGNLGSLEAGRGALEAGRLKVAAALEAARGAGDARAQLVAHNHFATLSKLVGDAAGHLAHTAQALELAREIGDRRLEGQLVANLALGEAMLGRHDEAMRLYAIARPIHAEVGDRKAEAVLLGNLAMEQERLAHLEEARSLYGQSLALYREIGAVDGEAQLMGNLAILLKRMGELAEAESVVREAIGMHRRAGARRSEGITLGTLGLVLLDRGDLEEAGRLQQEALAIHREVANRRSEGITLGNLGYVHQHAGRLVEAGRCYLEALAIHRETGNRSSEGQMLSNLGTLALARGDRAEARQWLREAVDAHRGTARLDRQAQAQGMLSELALDDGDDGEARRWLDEAEATATLFDGELPTDLAALRERLRER